MSTTREKLLGAGNGEVKGSVFERDDDKKRGSRNRLCIRFVPLSTNTDFNEGRFLSPSYAHLLEVSGDLDMGELTVLFSYGRQITLRGPNLKTIADNIENGTCGEVRQVDPLHAAGGDGTVALVSEMFEQMIQ